MPGHNPPGHLVGSGNLPPPLLLVVDLGPPHLVQKMIPVSLCAGWSTMLLDLLKTPSVSLLEGVNPLHRSHQLQLLTGNLPILGIDDLGCSLKSLVDGLALNLELPSIEIHVSGWATR